MKYYPLFLDLSGRCCLVVGGGSVAERKVKVLLRAGALVRLVAPELTQALRQLAARGDVEWVAGEFDTARGPEYLGGCTLAFAATSKQEVNQRVAEAARAAGVLVNAADSPEDCDFLAPAVVRRGDLAVAIGTAGSSPALARRLRERLEREIGPEYETLVGVLGVVRRRVLARGRPTRENEVLFRRLVDSPLLDLIAEGRQDAAAAMVKEICGVELPPGLFGRCFKGNK